MFWSEEFSQYWSTLSFSKATQFHCNKSTPVCSSQRGQTYYELIFKFLYSCHCTRFKKKIGIDKLPGNKILLPWHWFWISVGNRKQNKTIVTSVWKVDIKIVGLVFFLISNKIYQLKVVIFECDFRQTSAPFCST